MFTKYEERREQTMKNIETKYPKLAVKLDYLKEVWAEAFPN